MILTEAELTRWGRRIGEEIEAPAFLSLKGHLGAGKSVLARAIARGAGVDGAMPSPTFNVLFRYTSPRGFEISHLDLYRIEDADEVWELGWEELGTSGDIALVEWPERAADHLPSDRWDVVLSSVPDRPDVREVQVQRVGSPPDLPRFPLKIEMDG